MKNAVRTTPTKMDAFWWHWMYCKTCHLASWPTTHKGDHFCVTGKRLYEASMKEAS